MKKRRISPYLLVMLSFLIGLLVGGFVLCMPVSQKSGQWGSYIDNVFMATSAICVTGFDCYQEGLGNTLTLFGQIVELILIQIGGLGFITVLAFIITIFFRNISFSDRYYLSQATGSVDVPHVIRFVREIHLVTFLIEAIGFGLTLPAFIDMRGNNSSAYFNALFHTVSAFNNAGLDLFGGGTSFIRGVGNPWIDGMSSWAYYYLLIVTMLLIVLGALSYIALIEIFSFKKKPKQWSAHTKICVFMTGLLVTAGFVVFVLLEGAFKSENRMNPFDALFLSITSRTAGFATYDPSNLSIGGRVFDWLLMLIGGGPLGTASGLKTTTVFIIFVTIYSYIKGRKVTAFNRTFSITLIVKAMAVMLTSFFIIIFGHIILSQFEKSNASYSEEIGIYEVVSAFSNTGLSTGLTSSLSIGGKIIYVILMFIGRLGPMTMFSLFSNNMHIDEDKNHIRYVEEDILIG